MQIQNFAKQIQILGMGPATPSIQPLLEPTAKPAI
jgi:hypothetical protein